MEKKWRHMNKQTKQRKSKINNVFIMYHLNHNINMEINCKSGNRGQQGGKGKHNTYNVE